jgi:ATP-dependent DNA helicase RecQ
MSNRTEKEISETINVLISEGFLALTEGQYPVVKLQSEAADVLKGQREVMQRVPRPSKAAGSQRSGSRRDYSPSAVNETVFEQLRLIRRELASKEHVPSYIIFNDATLREMSVVCPQSEDEMLNVKGVGEVKFRKYGRPFLEFFLNGQGTSSDGDDLYDYE